MEPAELERLIENLRLDYANKEARFHELESNIGEYTTQLELRGSALKILQKIADHLAYDNLRELEKLVGNALTVIFDIPYTFHIVITERGNRKGLEFYVSTEYVKVVSLSGGQGGSILSVISFVLQVYYIELMGLRRILILDEPFVWVDTSHISALVQFINDLCEKNGWDILMVTRTKEFVDAVDKVITLDQVNGELRKVE